MKLNDKDYNLDTLISTIDFKSNELVNVKNKFDLTNYQIDVLKRFDVDYESVGSLKEVIYILESIYDDTFDEEIEIILDQISERDYYENTKK